MTTPRERLIEDGRISTATEIRDRILDRVVDGNAIIKEEQITSQGTGVLKYGLLHSGVSSIDKIYGTRSGNDIVFQSGTDYTLGTGVDADTIVWAGASYVPDSGTSFWVDYSYTDTTVTGITKKQVGGVLWIIVDSISQMIAEMYSNFAWYANQTYIDTASGTYLDMLGKLVGVTRQDATQSTGTVEVVNSTTSTLTITSGAKVSTMPKDYAKAIEVTFNEGHVLTAGNSGSYAVTAVESGAYGIGKYMIQRIVSGFSTTNDITVRNPSPIGGGQNNESDDDYRDRIKISFDYSGSDNRATIESIRSAIEDEDGIEYCRVYDAFYCKKNNLNDLNPPILYNGFAHAYIMFESKDAIFNRPIKVQQMLESDATKASLRTAINSTRAAGCTVFLMDIQDVVIDVNLTCTAKSGYATGDVATAIESAIETFINDQLAIGEDVYLSDITSLSYNIDGVLENSITCTIYESTPLYRFGSDGSDFTIDMWALDSTKKAPVYIICYDCATGTSTSSEVTVTFSYWDENYTEYTNGAATIPNGTNQWALVSPTTPLTTSDTRDIDNVVATGTTAGDKFEFRTRREATWIRVATAEKAWAGILNITVS